MAIIGDGFIDYVKKQIDIRQQALGEYNRNINSTKAFMTRTPWIRMVSSVNLTPGKEDFPGNSVLSTVKNSGNYNGIELSGDNLAKKFILFNGVSNQTGGIENLYSGIAGGPTPGFGGAYGFGSRDDIQTERGYVPMPGITNVNFQYKNDGALAMATVQIKAFSRSQFQLIDILFQRPGYTVLLEFGSTVYLDNNGNLVQASYDTKPFKCMFPEDGQKTDMFELHKVIAEEKEKWNGNYEGFFAKIAKWNWKFNSDGSYDITVNLVGMGDVIDSLKINVAVDEDESSSIDKDAVNKAKEENIVIISEALSSKFNNLLYSVYNIVKKSESNPTRETTISYTPSIIPGSPGSFTSSNPSPTTEYFTSLKINQFPVPIKNENGIVEKIENKDIIINYAAFKAYNSTNNTSKSYNPQVWITFGTLISLLVKSLNIKSIQNNIPFINFDFDFEKLHNDTNYIATFPGHFSSNPNVCIIHYDPISRDISDKISLPQTSLNESIIGGAKFVKEDNSLLGRLANVYLDINFIAKTFKESINEDKEVILIDFLQKILNEMNNTLGGINQFRIIHNKDNNLFEILVETPLNTKFGTDVKSSRHTINTFGVSPNNGSFVREMDLNSELTDKYATMITIGAQANGNLPQSNSTAFSIYNKGLEDRIIKETVNISNETPEIPPDPFLNLFTTKVENCFKEVYNKFQFTDENISILQNINSEFCKLATGVLTQKLKYPAPFFLPFNLSLTMDGLSGMKIYQSFQVDGKALPLTYNANDIQLIIKSLSHDVSPEGWLTKVETIAGPIIKISPTLQAGTYGDSPSNITSTPFTPAPTSPTSTPTPPPPSNINPLGRREAMLKAYNKIWGSTNEAGKQCGIYTSRLATWYKKYLTTRPPDPEKYVLNFTPRHANGDGINNLLLTLGYKNTQISSPNGGNILTKSQVINTINSTTFEYGDVVRYWALDGPPSENFRKYGHIQIYVGDINKSGWSSSFRENYGKSFVYRNSPGTQWRLEIYKAPSIGFSIGSPS